MPIFYLQSVGKKHWSKYIYETDFPKCWTTFFSFFLRFLCHFRRRPKPSIHPSPWRCSRIMLNMCSEYTYDATHCIFELFVEVNCLFIGLHLPSITAFESRKKISFRQVNKSVQSGWFMENAGSSNSHQNHITSSVILTSQP